MKKTILKIVGGVWPFIALPIVVYLTTEGILRFGSGDKDIFIAIPGFVFDVLYLVAYLVALHRGSTVGRAVGFGVLTALGVMLVLGIGIRVFLD